MKMLDLFQNFSVSTEPVAPSSSKQRSSSEENGFGKVLNAVESREETKYEPKDTKPVKPKDKEKDDQVKTKPDERKENEVDDSEKVPEKQKKTEKPEEKKDVAQKDDAPVSTAKEEEAIKEVAEILNISPEALAEMLAGLNMKITDLVDPQKVVALLQVALDAESPAALLSMPQFQEMFKAVNDVMADFSAVLNEAVNDTETTAQASERTKALENIQVTTDENGETQVTFDAEKPVATQTQTEDESVTPYSESEAVTTEAVTTEAVPRAQNASLQNNSAGTGTGTGTGAQPGNPQFSEIRVEVLDSADEQMGLAINTNSGTTGSTSQAASAETVRAAAASVVDANDVMSQIMSRIRTSGESFSEIRLTLRPENLGDISLRVSTQNGIVTAQFVAENQRVKEIIEANFNQLRDVLNEQGINFSALNVTVQQDNQNERMAQFEQGRQNSRVRADRITGIDGNAAEEPEEILADEFMRGNVNVRV